MGTLYLVGTPIGNLEDITLRALRVLREVAVIAAEDTRTVRKLLNHYEISTPAVAFHEYSTPARVLRLAERLTTEDIALVSEAGMPGISDPGYQLVVAALEHGVAVVPIPGPSAVTAALAASGLPSDSFLFLGFLPNRPPARRRLLQGVVGEERTLVLFESPHRLLGALEDMQATLGDRRLVIGREITKLHEEFWRGTISAAREEFGERGPRGEFTLVVAGAAPQEPARWTEEQVRAELEQLRGQGTSLSDAARQLALRSGWGRREVYDLGVRGGAPAGEEA